MMARRKGWVRLRSDFWLRENRDGTVTGVRVEDVRSSIEAKREMRQAVAGHIASETECKDTDLRFVGSMPATVANEMYDRCGNDPEKQRMFMRDNQHLILGIPANSANLPPRKTTIYSKGRAGK